ncbi:MAG: hypothetical protein NT079_03505 [Candidatus Omnitrophica bacterium]|nr:hypothetical protein [Candidatus Omnitrophota bacterium]
MVGGPNVGGFAGDNTSAITGCYYDSDTSGQPDSYATPKTTAQMMKEATFLASSWDFASIWCIIEDAIYPLLQWYAFTWDNGAGPGDLNWSTATNWVGHIAPSANNSVTFNNTSSSNSMINAGFGGTVANVHIYVGYNGTITQNRSLTVTGGFYQEDGTFTSIAANPFSAFSFALLDGIFNRFSGGSGVFGDPYQIANVYDLQAMKCFPAGFFVAINDFDASGTANWDDDGVLSTKEGFIPVGDDLTYFTGTLDGDNKIINGLTINRPTTDYVGLFGYVSGATISDVILTNADIDGSRYVGGIVGAMNALSTISNSSCGASVTGSSSVGGLVGKKDTGTISLSYATGDVTSTVAVLGANSLAGGLVGWSIGGTISNCYAQNTVDGDGKYVGGLVGGQNGGVVEYSYSAGAITGTSTTKGGFTGGKGGSPSYTSNYWDQTINPGLTSVGDHVEPGVGFIEPKTTALMKYRGTFAGWDFGDPEDTNYPTFQGGSHIWKGANSTSPVPPLPYIPLPPPPPSPPSPPFFDAKGWISWEEGDKNLKKFYAPGKYRVTATLKKGKIVFTPYNEKDGLQKNKSIVMFPGQTRIIEGEVKEEMIELGFDFENEAQTKIDNINTEEYMFGIYKTSVNAGDDFFEVATRDEKKIDYGKKRILKKGETAIEVGEVR